MADKALCLITPSLVGLIATLPAEEA